MKKVSCQVQLGTAAHEAQGSGLLRASQFFPRSRHTSDFKAVVPAAVRPDSMLPVRLGPTRACRVRRRNKTSTLNPQHPMSQRFTQP